MNLAWLKTWCYSWDGNLPDCPAGLEVAIEREYMQRQLRHRDNPFGLTVAVGCELPEPITEGQTLHWVERSHFCGRTLAQFWFLAVPVAPQFGGGLRWDIRESRAA